MCGPFGPLIDESDRKLYEDGGEDTPEANAVPRVFVSEDNTVVVVPPNGIAWYIDKNGNTDKSDITADTLASLHWYTELTPPASAAVTNAPVSSLTQEEVRQNLINWFHNNRWSDRDAVLIGMTAGAIRNDAMSHVMEVNHESGGKLERFGSPLQFLALAIHVLQMGLANVRLPNGADVASVPV